MAVILDGKALAEEIKTKISEEISILPYKVGLAVVIVGEDAASRIYVNNKKKDCAQCGIHSEEFALHADTGEEKLLKLIKELNGRKDINGILVQLPLPEGYNEDNVIRAISIDKDVDAFHPYNVGLIVTGKYKFLPCTPAGVMELLEKYNIGIEGRHCVIIGRSNIVGKPQSLLMLHKNGTVTICHSRTPDLAAVTKTADILVSAVGSEGLVTADMVKDGAVVIDVAMNRNTEGKLCGDVDFERVKEKASYITPVPGGVGPMTRAILMKNTLTAAKLQNEIEEAGINNTSSNSL